MQVVREVGGCMPVYVGCVGARRVFSPSLKYEYWHRVWKEDWIRRAARGKLHQAVLFGVLYVWHRMH